jgi:hypothetical protein
LPAWVYHRETGVIAQDVEAQLPNLISTWGSDKMRAVEYGRLTAVLIEAIKEQQTQIDDLKTRLKKLEQKP